MTFFLLDERNIIIGVFTEGINQIPDGAIQVSDEIAQQKLNDETSLLNCYEDGKLINKDIRTKEEITQEQRQLKLASFNEAWDNVKIGYSPIEKVAFQIKYGKEINETLEQNSLYNIETETPTLIDSSIHLYKTDKETISILTSKVTSKYEPTDNEFWYGSLGIYPLNMLEVGVILEKANKIIQSLADNILGVSE